MLHQARVFRLTQLLCLVSIQVAQAKEQNFVHVDHMP